MIITAVETPKDITLTFSTPINDKSANPKLEAAKEFYTGLVAFIKKRYKMKNAPVVDMNFAHYLEIEETFAIDEKGNTRWDFTAELVIHKEQKKSE